MSVPSGTAVAKLTVAAPVVAEPVSPPAARTPLAAVSVKAYDSSGAPLTSFGATPLTVSVGFAPPPAVDPARAEIDTLDPVSHLTQRLATAVVNNADGTYTATASTPHLSPFVVTLPQPAGTVATVLGGPTEGQAVDLPQGSQATAVDGKGVVYTTDGNVVRAIDPATGHESVVVGFNGWPPDSDTMVPEPGVNANPSGIYGLAVDHSNQLLLVDGYHQVIRRLDAHGILTTIAGGGSPADGVGDGLAATAAALNSPRSIAVDGADNLFILTDGSVRRVDAATGVITSAAGVSALGYPQAMTADRAGNLYVAGWDATAGIDTLWMVAPNGTATQIEQGTAVTSMAITRTGDLVAITSLGQIIDMAANPPGSAPPFRAPVVIAGTESGGFAGDDPQPAAGAPLEGPLQISAAGDGSLFFAEHGSRVRSITPDGTLVTYAGTDADPVPPTVVPSAVAISADGTTYVADRNSLYRVDASGTPTRVPVPGLHTENQAIDWLYGEGGRAGPPVLPSNITSLAVDSVGRVLIADQGQGRLLRFDPATGTTTTLRGPDDEYVIWYFGREDVQAGGPGSNVYHQLKSVAVDNAGRIFVVDGRALIQVGSSTLIQRAGSLDGVTAVAVDPAGTVHIAAGNAIYRLNLQSGDAAYEWYVANLSGLTFDPTGRRLVSGGGQIHRLTFSSTYNVTSDAVVAGTGTAGYNGDGLPGTQTAFQSASSMAVDSAGDLLVADTGNTRLRILIAPF